MLSFTFLKYEYHANNRPKLIISNRESRSQRAFYDQYYTPTFMQCETSSSDEAVGSVAQKETLTECASTEKLESQNINAEENDTFDDDFGDFEESSVTVQREIPHVSLSSLCSQIDAILDDSIIQIDFEDQSESVEEYESLEALLDQSPDTSTTKIWASLCIIEESLALKFTFLDSVVQKTYIESLGFDINLAKLSKRNVPRFAIHFNPLETLTPENLTGKISRNDSSPVLEILKDQGENSMPSSKNTTETLDIEFFASMDVKNVKTPEKLAPQICEESSKLEKKAPYVSTVQAEALKIAGKLPDLNFVLSPVLMFPLKETSAAASNEEMNGRF